LLSGDLGYLKKENILEFYNSIGEIERMLKALIKSLENKDLSKIPDFERETLDTLSKTPRFLEGIPRILLPN